MELIFLRHGHTDWNEQGLLQGTSDIPLNEKGRFGTMKLREVLSQWEFDAVYCSPLLRARQTLEIAYPQGVPVLDSRIAEWNFGVLEGTYVWDNDRYQRLWYPDAQPVECAERFENVISRVKEFYYDVSSAYPNGRVLVVSHGGVSAALQCALYGFPEGESARQYILPNCTPVLFRNGQAPWVLR